MPGEDAKDANGCDPRNPYTVDAKVDHRRLQSPGWIEPALLVRLALPGRAPPFGRPPEEPEPKPRPLAEATNGLASCSRRVNECREQRPVLLPVRKEDRPREARPAQKDVPGRSRLDGGGEYKRHCGRSDESQGSGHDRNYTSSDRL